MKQLGRRPVSSSGRAGIWTHEPSMRVWILWTLGYHPWDPGLWGHRDLVMLPSGCPVNFYLLSTSPRAPLSPLWLWPQSLTDWDRQSDIPGPSFTYLRLYWLHFLLPRLYLAECPGSIRRPISCHWMSLLPVSEQSLWSSSIVWLGSRMMS